MADYPTLLDGMMGSVQTTSVPAVIMRRMLAPRMGAKGLRATAAPLGLRRLEAALRRAGFAADEVAIVPPHLLAQAVGPATRVVALSSGDPLGEGMTSTTMSAMAGGQPFTRLWFAKLCADLQSLRKEGAANFHVAAGGPGAWQLAQNLEAAAALGIDAICLGYGEADAPALFERLAKQPRRRDKIERPQVIEASRVSLAQIPPTLGPTIMGIVEASRGCGRGCGFCTLAEEPVIHLPPEQIVADVQTNTTGGRRAISLIGEDFFRYGARA